MAKVERDGWRVFTTPFILYVFLLICGPLSAAAMPGHQRLLSNANGSTPNSREQDLAGLHDIRLPEAIGWWPVAPGWYVLAALLIIALLIVGFFLKRHGSNVRARRQALRLLTVYEQEYVDKGDSQLSASRVSELLKRVALAYFPRAKVAALQGEDWLLFLNNTSKGVDFNSVRTDMLETPYQPSRVRDLQLLFSTARQWIKQRRVPCLN